MHDLEIRAPIFLVDSIGIHTFLRRDLFIFKVIFGIKFIGSNETPRSLVHGMVGPNSILLAGKIT